SAQNENPHVAPPAGPKLAASRWGRGVAMSETALQDDPVVDLKERSPSSRVRSEKEPDEVLTRQQVYDFLVSERDRVRFCGTLPLTVFIWFIFTLTAWTHGNVERTSRAQSVIRYAVEKIEARE
ncbi:unnamed protein product, partial [Effrenium voratum]